MSVFVYAAPYAPTPEPSETRWPGITQTWTGFDGVTWTLTDAEQGVYLPNDASVRGLDDPLFELTMLETAGSHGARYLGYRAPARDVHWLLEVFADSSSQAWIDLHRAFFRTIKPHRPGVWRVTAPDGSWRELVCRARPVTAHSFDLDPTVQGRGWDVFEVDLVAEDPFWRGQQVVREWDQTVGEPFFGGTGGGGFAPPFFISSSQTLATATVDNPGDEPAAVTWWVESATTSAVGVGGMQVVVPFEVAAGRLLVLDGSPAELTAVEVDAPPSDLVAPAGVSLDEARAAWVAEHLPAGTDRTLELGDAEWAMIPAGASTVLSLEATGAAARITARFTPAYHRAW